MVDVSIVRLVLTSLLNSFLCTSSDCTGQDFTASRPAPHETQKLECGVATVRAMHWSCDVGERNPMCSGVTRQEWKGMPETHRLSVHAKYQLQCCALCGMLRSKSGVHNTAWWFAGSLAKSVKPALYANMRHPTVSQGCIFTRVAFRQRRPHRRKHLQLLILVTMLEATPR